MTPGNSTALANMEVVLPTHNLSVSFVMNGLLLPRPDPRCVDLMECVERQRPHL
jgi:hypothetical protein